MGGDYGPVGLAFSPVWLPRAAMARGALLVRTVEASSAKVTPLAWCRASTSRRATLSAKILTEV